MSIKTKSIVLLFVTLIMGLVAGATITGALVRERLEYIRSFSKSHGFALRFSEMIGPLSDQQRDEVEPLLDAAGREIEIAFSDSGRRIYSIVEQLEEDLIPHLSDEQIAQLQKRRAEIRNRYIGRFTVATEEDFPTDEGLANGE